MIQLKTRVDLIDPSLIRSELDHQLIDFISLIKPMLFLKKKKDFGDNWLLGFKIMI
jgi:hypothetical protein